MECADEGSESSVRLKSESSPFWGGITQIGKEEQTKQRSGRNMSQAERQVQHPKRRWKAYMLRKWSKRKDSVREVGRAILCRAMKDMVKGWCSLFCFPSRATLRKNNAKLKNHHWGGHQWGQGFLRGSFHSTSTLNTDLTGTSPSISLAAKRGGWSCLVGRLGD